LAEQLFFCQLETDKKSLGSFYFFFSENKISKKICFTVLFYHTLCPLSIQKLKKFKIFQIFFEFNFFKHYF